MIFNKKILTIISSFLLVVSLTLIVKPYERTAFTSTYGVEKPTIILDAGHAALENTID